MLEAFNTVIKPLNDQLGESLGINQISVKEDHTANQVTVYVAMLGPDGNKIFVPSHKIKTAKVLGLAVRSSDE